MIRILLAEDNDNLAALLEKFLVQQGFDVSRARDGLEALQLYSSGEADLLVLDLRLPRLPGHEVLRKIRQTPRGKELPVVIISGAYRGAAYVEAAARLGVRQYLEKPFRPGVFLAAVRAAISPEPVSPVEILLSLHREEKTGVLQAPQIAPILLLKGEPVSFISRGRREFVSFLAARGRITGDEAEAAISSGQDRLFLTRTGLLTFEELSAESHLFLAAELRKAATSAVVFDPHHLPFEHPLTLVPLPQFLYDQVGTGLFAAVAEGESPLFPARTSQFYRISNLLTLLPQDIETLQRVSGQCSLREICAGSSDAGRVLDFLSFLQVTGMVRLLEAPGEEEDADFPVKTQFNRPLSEEVDLHAGPIQFDDLVEEVSDSVEKAVGNEKMAVPLSPAEIGFEQTVVRDHGALQGKNFYEIFGLTPQAFSFEALKQAYFERKKEYTPDRFMELTGSTSSLAEEVLATYANAYNTLSNVISKERYDEMLNADTVGLAGKQDERLQAKIQLQSGKVFLEMGEYDNAVKSLQDAYTLLPDDPANCAYLAWCLYRNPANRTSRGTLERARSLLSRSLQMQKNAAAYAFRGWMLLDEGREGLAEGEFQKALKLDPQDMHARKGMRQITEKREADRKGIFRKIFG